MVGLIDRISNFLGCNVKKDECIDEEEITEDQNLVYKNSHRNLRPKTFNDFIGESNKHIVDRLDMAIKSANKRDAQLKHILLYGNQGLGKTTISNIIANEYQSELLTVTGSTINNQKDIWQLLFKIADYQAEDRHVVLFIDEIHDLSCEKAPETLWYPLLEDFVFYQNLEGTKIKTPHGEEVIITTSVNHIAPFTVIGATTDPGKLSAPLRDRFQISCYLKEYTTNDLTELLTKYCDRSSISTDKAAVQAVAKRGRGNPRITINLLLSCYDRAVVTNDGLINKDIVTKQMNSDCIDEEGMTELDMKILKVLYNNPKGLGIGNLASSSNTRRQTIEELVEPFLKGRGYLMTTHRRFITDKGTQLLERKEKK